MRPPLKRISVNIESFSDIFLIIKQTHIHEDCVGNMFVISCLTSFKTTNAAPDGKHRRLINLL